MKIDLPLSFDKGWRITQAEIVDIAPHLAGIFTFAVHDSSAFPVDVRQLWRISDVETGHAITGVARKTKRDAITAARIALLNVSRQKAVALLQRAATELKRKGML